jgi:hypothetical protein
MFLAGGLEALIWTVLLLPFWTYGSSRIFLGSGPGLGLAPPLRRRVGPVLTGLIVVGGMALLLAAVQLLPTLELIGNSTRLEGVNPVEAARFVATPGRATGLLLPWVTWDPETMTSWLNLTGDVRAHFLPSLFLGATALALALLGWTRAPRGERAVAATLGVLALLFGLGSDLPLIGTVARLVPGSSHYRFDEKYLVLFTLSIAYFSAWGFEAQLNRRRLARLQAGMRERRWGSGLLVGVGIVGLAAAALLFLVGAERASFLLRWGGQQVWSAQSDAMASFHARQVSGLLLTSLVALACGLLLTVRAARRIPAATAAVLVIGLVGLELGLAGARFYRTTSLSKLRQPAAPASVVLGEGNGARAARWVLFDDESASLEHLQNPDGQLDLYRSWLVPNLGPFQGVPTFDGSGTVRRRPRGALPVAEQIRGCARNPGGAGAVSAVSDDRESAGQHDLCSSARRVPERVVPSAASAGFRLAVGSRCGGGDPKAAKPGTASRSPGRAQPRTGHDVSRLQPGPHSTGRGVAHRGTRLADRGTRKAE